MDRTLHNKEQAIQKKFEKTRDNYLRDLNKLRSRYQTALASLANDYARATQTTE